VVWITSARLIRILLLLALVSSGGVCFGGLVFSQKAAAQGAIVRQIQVEGNRRVEPETVSSYLRFSVGDAYDLGKVNRSIKSLFATGLFSDVQIDREGGIVIVTVAENPVISQVAFEGNSEIDTATLVGEVQLKPRSVFTRARAQSDVQRILDVYRRQGRYAATVEPKIIELEQDRVNLVFEISEGKATKVKGINFIGNNAFSDTQLRDVISTTEKGWFDFLKGTSIYDPDRMNLDRELLRQYYLKNGYADAQVTVANAELDRDGTGFFVTFAVEEGERYSFGAVSVDSTVSAINPEDVRSEIKTEEGDIYNAQLIDKSTEAITLAASQQGYAFARVRPRAYADPVSHTIAMSYTIEEGSRIYIERINIIGNVRTKDYVIRREFQLAEGDAYNPLLVDQAKKRVERLGFFEKTAVKRRPGSAPDRVVLDVVIVEKSTGELSFGGGYSTAEGVIGDISITERNLMGNGQFLRLKLAGSFERMQIDLSFTEPRFLDLNMAAGFDLFHKEIDQTSQSGFKNRTTGGALRLGFPLSNRLWMQTSYSLARDEIYDVSPFASAAITEGTFLTSALGTGLTYDHRDHPKNPTHGIYASLNGTFAGLGGDVQYARAQAEVRGYYPITDNLQFVSRAISGYVAPWGGQDLRTSDLFFKGGETIRGFERAGFGPRDMLTRDSLGGTTYWATTAEVRFPIPLVPDDLGIKGAVFADAGSLFGAGQFALGLNKNCGDPGDPGAVPPVPPPPQVCLQDSTAVRSSVGASILWESPVGPIRMDFAKVLTKQSYDVEQMFRFGAQTNF
jgi:outer membrane protein insertion porin family